MCIRDSCKRSFETEDNPQVVDVDVVVIGAGISGLSAAYYIQQKDAGIRLAVLEAKGEKQCIYHLINPLL